MLNPTRTPVMQDWLLALPLQMQSVALLACRFADGARKDHPFKPLQQCYRAHVLNAARFGRPLIKDGRYEKCEGELIREGDSFMQLPYGDSYRAFFVWNIRTIENNVDDLPHHYLMHFAHGAEILGYYHPDVSESWGVRQFWNYVYYEICKCQHMHPETKEELENRLSDWEREYWS